MPRKIPASLTGAYNRAVKRQGSAAERSARAALRAFMAENPGAGVEDMREFAIEVMTAAGDLYGNACSQAALDLQHAIAEEFGTRPPSVEGWLYEPDAESIRRTAHYQAGKLAGGDVDGFVEQIADAARYYAERGANATMAETARKQAEKDGGRRRRKGARTKDVLFARVPSGPTTCPFCLMLASRGFVYLSEESAGEFDQYHRHCDCRIVPGYPGMELEGYDPDAYYDMWKHPEKYEQDIYEYDYVSQTQLDVSIPSKEIGNYDDFIPLKINEKEVKCLKELNSLSQENGYEYGQIIGPSWSSDAFTSELPDKVKFKLPDDDTSHYGLYHSHTNVTPLSADDFAKLCDERIDSVANIAINGDTYMVSIGNGWRPSREDFDKVVKQIAFEVDIDMVQLDEFQDWSYPERNYMAIKEQAFRIARYFEWDLMGGHIDEQ